MQPPPSYPCSLPQVFFSLFLFSLFSLSSEPVSCVPSTSPRPHTGDTPSAPTRHRNYSANPKPQISHFPSFPPSSLMVQDTPPPRRRPVAAPRGMQAPTPPPLAPMQAAPSLLPQPPPPQYLYDRRHLTDTVALQPASPDFVTQTGGAKGALGPTISVTPPFTHPPCLCRSSHLHGCPHCAP